MKPIFPRCKHTAVTPTVKPGTALKWTAAEQTTVLFHSHLDQITTTGCWKAFPTLVTSGGFWFGLKLRSYTQMRHFQPTHTPFRFGVGSLVFNPVFPWFWTLDTCLFCLLFSQLCPFYIYTLHLFEVLYWFYRIISAVIVPTRKTAGLP